MSLINVQAGVALHLVDRKPEQVADRADGDQGRQQGGAGRAARAGRRAARRDRGRPAASRRRCSPRSTTWSSAARTPASTVHKVVEGDVRPAARRRRARGVPDRAGGDHQRGPALRRAARRRTARLRCRRAVGPGRRRRQRREASARRSEPGSGLRGMRERAAALGGTLTVGAAPAGGVPHRGRPAGRRRPVIRVVLADDQALLRAGLPRAARRRGRHRGRRRGRERRARRSAWSRATRPDVVLMDIRMPRHRRARGHPAITADPAWPAPGSSS